jgi:hypothetical protein
MFICVTNVICWGRRTRYMVKAKACVSKNLACMLGRDMCGAEHGDERRTAYADDCTMSFVPLPAFGTRVCLDNGEARLEEDQNVKKVYNIACNYFVEYIFFCGQQESFLLSIRFARERVFLTSVLILHTYRYPSPHYYYCCCYYY